MDKRKKFILWGVILAMLLSSLDQTIVSTALPNIVRELNGINHLSWVFIAYMLASTIAVPIYGKLSDLFGRRNLYILGIIIFLVGSALCGLSQNMTQLILFRGLQGIWWWAMMVNSLALIWEVFPPAERGKWQGLLWGIFGLASVWWPLLWGWITDHLSWRRVFYVNLPIGILAIAVLAVAIPKIARDLKHRSIDYLWAFFISAALIPILLALVRWWSQYARASWQIITAFAIGIISLIWFVIVEKRVKEPILSMWLFANRVFLVSVICLFFISMGMFWAIMYIPIFAQWVIGGSATSAGLVLTPLMGGLILASAISGRIISKTWKYKLLTLLWFLIIILGMYLFSSIGVGTTKTILIIYMVVLGIGLGITMPVFTIAVQASVSKKRLGEVTAGTQLFRNIWWSVGTAILGGVMSVSLAGRASALSTQPFVKVLSKLPGGKFASLDSNALQQMLSPTVQSVVKSQLTHRNLATFESFLVVVKKAFSYSIDHVFIIGCGLMSLWLIAALFLPEIALKKKEEMSLEEVGLELWDELETGTTNHQPRIAWYEHWKVKKKVKRKWKSLLKK